MSKLLKQAVAEIASLPESVQDEIGRDLLARIARLMPLRAELEQAVRCLDRGEGKELDIEGLIRRAHATNDRS